MSTKRTTLAPNPMYGWRAETNIEIERIAPRAFGTTSAFAIYANGDLIGYMESRLTGLSGKSREWAHWTPEEYTETASPYGIFSARSRHDAALPLAEAYQRTH